LSFGLLLSAKQNTCKVYCKGLYTQADMSELADEADFLLSWH